MQRGPSCSGRPAFISTERRREQRRGIGYRDAEVAESRGEAQRFNALVAEYQAAPEVTKKRLYLETMEVVLPEVEKIIIEPGAASILPYLPLASGSRGTP